MLSAAWHHCGDRPCWVSGLIPPAAFWAQGLRGEAESCGTAGAGDAAAESVWARVGSVVLAAGPGVRAQGLGTICLPMSDSSPAARGHKWDAGMTPTPLIPGHSRRAPRSPGNRGQVGVQRSVHEKCPWLGARSPEGLKALSPGHCARTPLPIIHGHTEPVYTLGCPPPACWQETAVARARLSPFPEEPGSERYPFPVPGLGQFGDPPGTPRPTVAALLGRAGRVLTSKTGLYQCHLYVSKQIKRC